MIFVKKKRNYAFELKSMTSKIIEFLFILIMSLLAGSFELPNMPSPLSIAFGSWQI